MPPPKKAPVLSQHYILCVTHGRTVWRRTIRCGACLRVYQWIDPAAELYAPEKCECGARLLPAASAAGDIELIRCASALVIPNRLWGFSARPVCSHCYAEALPR